MRTIDERLVKAVAAQDALAIAQAALMNLRIDPTFNPDLRGRVTGALDNVVYALTDVDRVVGELRGLYQQSSPGMSDAPHPPVLLTEHQDDLISDGWRNK